MNFTYDAIADALYVSLRDDEAKVAVTQPMQHIKGVTVNVDIAEDGQLFGIEIIGPGHSPWPIRELLARYPTTTAQSFFLITLAERYRLFAF